MADRYSFEDLFAELFPAKFKGLVELRALPSKHRIFVHPSHLHEIRHFLDQHRADNIFFGVASRAKSGDGSLANCHDLWAFWVDIDFDKLPEVEARRRLAKFPLPPSIIISSGHGLHAYWLLAHVVDLTSS